MAVPVDPLLEVGAALPIIGLGTNVDRFINIIPIASMDDFALMHGDEVKSVMETCNKSQTRAHNMGFLVQKKLQDLLYWYHGKERR